MCGEKKNSSFVDVIIVVVCKAKAWLKSQMFSDYIVNYYFSKPLNFICYYYFFFI